MLCFRSLKWGKYGLNAFTFISVLHIGAISFDVPVLNKFLLQALKLLEILGSHMISDPINRYNQITLHCQPAIHKIDHLGELNLFVIVLIKFRKYIIEIRVPVLKASVFLPHYVSQLFCLSLVKCPQFPLITFYMRLVTLNDLCKLCFN